MNKNSKGDRDVEAIRRRRDLEKEALDREKREASEARSRWDAGWQALESAVLQCSDRGTKRSRADAAKTIVRLARLAKEDGWTWRVTVANERAHQRLIREEAGEDVGRIYVPEIVLLLQLLVQAVDGASAAAIARTMEDITVDWRLARAVEHAQFDVVAAQNRREPEPAASEVTYSPGDLARQLGIGTRTLCEHGKACGVDTPGPGKSNFRYPHIDAVKIARRLSEHTRRRIAERSRKWLEEIARESRK